MELVPEKKRKLSRQRKTADFRRVHLVFIWHDDPNMEAVGISTLNVAQEVETLLNRFSNAAVNTDEQRRLRAALYLPLLKLDKDERSRVVDRVLSILLDTDTDV